MFFKVKFLLTICLTILSFSKSSFSSDPTVPVSPKLLADSSLLGNAALAALIEETNQQGRRDILKNDKCFADGNPETPLGNCIKVSLIFKRGAGAYQAVSYPKIYHSKWIDRVASEAIYYTGDSYLPSRRVAEKTIPKQVDDAIFARILPNMELLYGADSPKVNTLRTDGIPALSVLAESMFHSETAFFTSIMQRKTHNFATTIRQPHDTVILHMVSTNPPCPNCTPVLKRLLTNDELKGAISGVADTNLHVVYTYLIDSETKPNPFRGHVQTEAVTLTADTSRFLGIYLPFE